MKFKKTIIARGLFEYGDQANDGIERVLKEPITLQDQSVYYGYW